MLMQAVKLLFHYVVSQYFLVIEVSTDRDRPWLGSRIQWTSKYVSQNPREYLLGIGIKSFFQHHASLLLERSERNVLASQGAA